MKKLNPRPGGKHKKNPASIESEKTDALNVTLPADKTPKVEEENHDHDGKHKKHDVLEKIYHVFHLLYLLLAIIVDFIPLPYFGTGIEIFVFLIICILFYKK